MPKKPADVTDTELAILDVLWDRGPSTIREIVTAIYGAHSSTLHATIKSLLERLADKGLVESDRTGFAHRFVALIAREKFVGEQLQKLADSHFDGSLAPMLLTLVDRVKLSRKERDAIRRIVENIR